VAKIVTSASLADQVISAIGAEVFLGEVGAHGRQILSGQGNAAWTFSCSSAIASIQPFRRRRRDGTSAGSEWRAGRHVFNRLVGRAVFAKANGIMGQNVDDALMPMSAARRIDGRQ
jgi:hypothetical protein